MRVRVYMKPIIMNVPDPNKALYSDEDFDFDAYVEDFLIDHLYTYDPEISHYKYMGRA